MRSHHLCLKSLTARLRRRGYPPTALRRLCELIGVTKVPTSVIELSLLENCVRDALQEEVTVKALCVLRPLKVGTQGKVVQTLPCALNSFRMGEDT